VARFRLPRPWRARSTPRRPPAALRWFLRERRSDAGSTTPPPEPTPPEPPRPEPPPRPAPPPPPPAEEPAEPAAGRSPGAAIRGIAADIGRVPVAVGSGARGFWFGMSVTTRRHLAIALASLVALLLLVFVAVPALPCQAPGGDACPPADDAIALVPDDALGYIHVNADPDSEQYDEARVVADRIPTLSTQLTRSLLSRVPGPSGAPPGFDRDIGPWFGGEAALAIVPAGERAAEEVQLLEAADADAAREFADSVATGTPEATDYRGVEIDVDRRGLATAVVGGFLAIGRESGVRDVIDAQSGATGTGSLADDLGAKAARDELPDLRFADAYLSPDGIARLVGNPRGPLATLDAVVDPVASEGVAAALVASDEGIDLAIRSVLDSERARAQPGFFAAFPEFEPTLAGSLPVDSLAYVGIGDPEHTLISLLEQASADQPGIAAGVSDLVKRVRELGKVDLETELLPSLGGEAAFALEPSGQAAPYLEFLGSGIDAERAGRALASLQAPIADALSPTGGQAPTFSERDVGGVTSHSVRLSPTVDLTYAVVESVLVVATDPLAVKRYVDGEGGLSEADSFTEATDGLSGRVSLLAYLDLSGLIALGEQAGLAQDPAYETFADEIHKLQALGLAVRSSDTELTTDVNLIVGEDASSGTLQSGTVSRP
jgi:hypothetical protein